MIGTTARSTRRLSTRPFSNLAAQLLIAALGAGSAACGGSSSNTPPPPSAPAVSLPASVAFGNVGQGTTSPPMTVTLTNTGTAALTFSANPALSGANAADFAISAMTCSTSNSVVAGGTCTVTLTFKPSTTTTESGSLTFSDNAANTPQSVVLSGTGQVPVAGATLPVSLPFGSVVQGMTSSPMTVTVTSSGNIPLTFTAPPAISGTNAADFMISSSPTCVVGTPVAAGSTCAVSVTFTPSTFTPETASLVFTDNAPGSPQTVALTGTGVVQVSNTVPVQVNLGPAGNDVNILFVTVTICVPGTANCQQIPNVEVDTGSNGLRLLSSVVTLPLTTATNGSGNPFGDCVQFADLSYAWGPIQTADVQLGGEVAASQPIQVINAPGFPAVPNSCKQSGGTNLTDVTSLGANGIIGMGIFRQDCGLACATSAIAGTYYTCVGTTCTPTTMPLNGQLQNPVWHFAQDNNGMLVVLPSVPAAGADVVNGTIIFGIGTQGNNSLGTATIYTTDTSGNYTVSSTAGSSSSSFVDSGSNGLFFLNAAQTGLTNCPNNVAQGFYCSNASFTLTTTGNNGAVGQVMISVVSAQTLFQSPTASAFSNLAGPFPGAYDLGLSFFFDRTVLIGIENQTTGTTQGPFFAY